jgi:flagellar biosynthesis regulator FlbT
MTESVALKTLPLERGEVVVVNGLPIRMAEDGTLQVPAGARVMTKDHFIVDSRQADTAAKRIFFVLQAMTLDAAHAELYRADLMRLLDDRAESSSLPPVLKSLAMISDLATRGDYMGALEICRHLISFDEALTSDFPALEAV